MPEDSCYLTDTEESDRLGHVIPISKDQHIYEVMGLDGSDSPEAAQAIVDQYAANELEILQHDFYKSLLAAFTENEIGSQLARMNLTRLLIDVVDDRHRVVGGIVYYAGVVISILELFLSI